MKSTSLRKVTPIVPYFTNTEYKISACIGCVYATPDDTDWTEATCEFPKYNGQQDFSRKCVDHGKRLEWIYIRRSKEAYEEYELPRFNVQLMGVAP